MLEYMDDLNQTLNNLTINNPYYVTYFSILAGLIMILAIIKNIKELFSK
jgi:hypothetical protein